MTIQAQSPISDLPESVETVVVGGGQAGLAVGYHLAQRDLPFVILDAGARTGDAWRNRWDSLRVFTQARYSGLPGMRFPAPSTHYPTKDEVADYLESYAARFDLPVHHGTRVERVWKEDGVFAVSTGDRCISARNVVVAMSSYQRPRVPAFAGHLDSSIVQLHSHGYRNPSQFADGPALVVGASDSGAEIAVEASRTRQTFLSGPHPGHVPFRLESAVGRFVGVPLVVGQFFHHVTAITTPVGRRMRSKVIGHAGPNVRVKPKDVAAAGVERVGRTVGVKNGRPALDDGRVLDVANVVWCTGFRPDFSWIDLPVFGAGDDPDEPQHRAGIVESEPGLYFVGLFFLYALSSSLLRGVGRDAERVVEAIARRTAEARRSRTE